MNLKTIKYQKTKKIKLAKLKPKTTESQMMKMPANQRKH